MSYYDPKTGAEVTPDPEGLLQGIVTDAIDVDGGTPVTIYKRDRPAQTITVNSDAELNYLRKAAAKGWSAAEPVEHGVLTPKVKTPFESGVERASSIMQAADPLGPIMPGRPLSEQANAIGGQLVGGAQMVTANQAVPGLVHGAEALGAAGIIEQDSVEAFRNKLRELSASDDAVVGGVKTMAASMLLGGSGGLAASGADAAAVAESSGALTGLAKAAIGGIPEVVSSTIGRVLATPASRLLAKGGFPLLGKIAEVAVNTVGTGAALGGLFGAGQGMTEQALGSPGLTAETSLAASTLAGVEAGAAMGAGFGALGVFGVILGGAARAGYYKLGAAMAERKWGKPISPSPMLKELEQVAKLEGVKDEIFRLEQAPQKRYIEQAEAFGQKNRAIAALDAQKAAQEAEYQAALGVHKEQVAANETAYAQAKQEYKASVDALPDRAARAVAEKVGLTEKTFNVISKRGFGKAEDIANHGANVVAELQVPGVHQDGKPIIIGNAPQSNLIRLNEATRYQGDRIGSAVRELSAASDEISAPLIKELKLLQASSADPKMGAAAAEAAIKAKHFEGRLQLEQLWQLRRDAWGGSRAVRKIYDTHWQAALDKLSEAGKSETVNALLEANGHYKLLRDVDIKAHGVTAFPKTPEVLMPVRPEMPAAPERPLKPKALPGLPSEPPPLGRLTDVQRLKISELRGQERLLANAPTGTVEPLVPEPGLKLTGKLALQVGKAGTYFGMGWPLGAASNALGAARTISTQALSTMEALQQARQGMVAVDRAMQKSVDGFMTGASYAPRALSILTRVTGKKDRNAAANHLLDQYAQLAADSQRFTDRFANAVGDVSTHMSQVAMIMSERATTALKLMNEVLPRSIPNEDQPLIRKPFSEARLAEAERGLTAIFAPLETIERLRSGAATPNELRLLREVWPELTNAFINDLREKVMTSKVKLTTKQDNIYKRLVSGGVMAYTAASQKTYMVEQPAPKPSGGGKTSKQPASLTTPAQQGNMPLQRKSP